MSNDFGGKKRSELPDNVFGIPQERKYPMPDEKHTRSAIKLFNHVEPKYEEQLAKAIIKNMKKYNIDGSVVGPNNRLRKYLPKDMIKECIEYVMMDYNVMRGAQFIPKRNSRIYGAYLTEGMSNTIKKDHKQKGHIKLSSLKKVRITEYLIDKYKKEYPVLRHVRCKDTDEYVCDGYMWFKDDSLVGYVGSCQYTDDNTKWIVSLEILPEYRGYGLSNQILDFCVKSMNCKYLSVNKNNQLAKKIYDKYGFKVYHEDKSMYYMTLDNISSSNESMISITEKAKYDPPYTAEEVKRVYGTKVYKELRKDPAHKYRMDTGIELIHREPTKEELERIWKNWNLMSDDQKMKSDKKSMELFGKTNQDHYNELINSYVVNESYIEESSSRKITTVVFDLGDVLIKSNMQEKLRKNPKIPNQQIYPLLEKWFDDDLDLLSKEEYIDTISKRLAPDFSDIVPDIVDAFSDIEVLPYTIPTLKDLKERGYNIYYLSNWSRWGVEILREKNKLDFLSLFDGGLFSYEVGVKKPDRKIYDAFLKKFKINPKEAIFVDNKKKNIDAAKKFGLQGVLFDKLDIGLVYEVLTESNDITMEKFIFGSKVKVSMNKIAKEIVKNIKPIVFTSKNKQQASRIGLTLKCEVESLDHNTICILILDGPQDARDGKEARLLLSNIQNDCKSKMVGYVSKITTGDGDEGCLYFTPNKKYIEKHRKDLIQESSGYQIKQSEINDIKEIISSLNDDSFKGFNFKNIVYYDIRHKSKKPIAFITIRTKSINNCTVGYVSLAVDPKYQNQGIGKSLTEKAIQWFKTERGIDFLEWWCLPDNEASSKLANAAGFREYIARDQSEYIHYTMESTVSEYGTTGGTIVGTNQPDSVYIVNYMQNNAFSGHKEPKFGICKKGMKDLHVVGGKYNRFHYVSDLDKFKEEASDIHMYRFKGKPKNEFFDIIEEMKGDNDLDLYKLLTGREIKDRSDIIFDGDFVEEECFLDEIDAIKACTEAGLLEAATDLHPVPILTESVQGRPYNYYRDLNGVFIQNEITKLRSKSYETLEDIPKAEKDMVKRGYLV